MVFESVEGDQVWLHICEGIRKQRQDFLQRVSLRIIHHVIRSFGSTLIINHFQVKVLSAEGYLIKN